MLSCWVTGRTRADTAVLVPVRGKHTHTRNETETLTTHTHSLMLMNNPDVLTVLTDTGVCRRVSLTLPLATPVPGADTLLGVTLCVLLSPGLTDTIRRPHVLIITAI